MRNRKILIVGAGFAGSTFARLAAENGFYVEIIDSRSHSGGNSFSHKDRDTGIEIHKYGPHIFHTSSEKVFNFINRFAKFNGYIHKVKAIAGGHVYSLPINLHTINQFFGNLLSPREAREFIKRKQLHTDNVTNFEQAVLASLGRELYEAFFRDYTIKHWGKDPKELPASTAKRLPVRYNYNDNYFDDRYQGIPAEGYGELFDRMLQHQNIKVFLKTSFDSIKAEWRKKYGCLVFTGSIDEYYDYRYGYLPYRTVNFEEIRDDEIQGSSVINYTDNSVPFTRIHEHKYFTPDKDFSKSVGFKEFAAETTSKENPFYPINDLPSKAIFSQYKKAAEQERDVIFIGRLAEYRYFNMDQAIDSSMRSFEKFMKTPGFA
jgi:UDP-galactopyranose mutase